MLSRAYAGEDNTIRLALVGCGGRGGGAAANALSSQAGPTKLVAMADVFEDRLTNSHKALSEQFAAQIDVPPERRFIGFDAYRKAIDCLRPGRDVMIQATHSAFRPTHLKYAVEKGVNAFIEKSFAPDPGGTKEILRLGEEAIYPDFTQRAAVEQGAVDAATGFSNNEPVQLELDGTKAVVLHIDQITPLPGPGPDRGREDARPTSTTRSPGSWPPRSAR